MSMDLLDLGSGSSGIISGPTYLNRSCNMMMVMNSVSCGGGGTQPVDVRSKQQQQQHQLFDSVSKSPGGMPMASSAGSMGFFPFTSAQWKELERQAMVFKYMMHSIPVPYELLFPFISASTNLSDPSGMMIRRDTHLLKFLKNGDPEPGRCRRTDGKKWRCSNAVALDHKYCEKHVHRGRPRSRKHVESAAASDLTKIHKKPCLAHNHNQTQNESNISPHVLLSKPISGPQVSVSKPTSGPQSGACYKPDQLLLPRCTAGFTNPAFQLRNGDLSDEQLHQLMQFQRHQQLGLNSYAQRPKQEMQEINLFLNRNLKKPISTLIDAWTANGNDNTSNTQHDLVSLALSMGHRSYNADDDVDVNESQNKQEREQSHISNWLTQSGGPLGEVLRPPLTPSPTTTATGESSPSCTGVLQEAVASLSDGARHTSSASAAFPSQSHFDLQWFNQDKLVKQNST